jgi:hypothetical protein
MHHPFDLVPPGRLQPLPGVAPHPLLGADQRQEHEGAPAPRQERAGVDVLEHHSQRSEPHRDLVAVADVRGQDAAPVLRALVGEIAAAAAGDAAVAVPQEKAAPWRP